MKKMWQALLALQGIVNLDANVSTVTDTKFAVVVVTGLRCTFWAQQSCFIAFPGREDSLAHHQVRMRWW